MQAITIRSVCVWLLIVLTGCGMGDKSGVVELHPQIFPLPTNSELRVYLEEFPFTWPKKRPEPSPPPDRLQIRGKLLMADHIEGLDLWAALSYEGKYWNQSQNIYVWRHATNALQQLGGFDNQVVSQLALITNASPALILEGDELVKYDLVSKQHSSLGPGHNILLSPDRQKMVFLRSERSGYHSVHLLDVGSGQIRPILSLWEVDPGSGTSFVYLWSNDSKAVFFVGDTQGFSRNHLAGPKRFYFLCRLDDGRIYEVPRPTAHS